MRLKYTQKYKTCHLKVQTAKTTSCYILHFLLLSIKSTVIIMRQKDHYDKDAFR